MDNADDGREAASPATDYRSLTPFRAAVTRRRFFQLGGTAAGVAIAAGAGTQLGGTTSAAAAAKPGHRTGTIADLKHVVILMQENRSFDHYFGSLRGVRGFADKQALKYPDGTTIFEQPDTARTDLGYLLPFHMDSSKVNAQNAGDLDHSWDGDHSARNNGLWNNWVPAKTEQTMGYFTRADIPFQYALADAFTICDGYHQAILAPTSPNRMYFWTGTSGGWTSNPDDYTVEFSGADSITTYPELLQRAGLTWQVYTNHEVGDGGGVQRLGRRLRRQPAVVLPAVPELGAGAHRGGAGTGQARRRPALAAQRWRAARPEPGQPRAGPVPRRRHRRYFAAGLLDRGAV